ncbi:MAG: thiamine phosphate synthase [Myxococcales bacterium]|nr:thiamine phosphate synthase [Myxococcales bacterium]
MRRRTPRSFAFAQDDNDAHPSQTRIVNPTPKHVPPRGLYLIVDPEVSVLAPERVVEIAFAAGARLFQLRAKRMAPRDALSLARRIRALVPKGEGLFIVNDRVDLAGLADADGVHLGREDLPIDVARAQLGAGAVVGASTHTVEEALEAERTGADYVGFGPMNPTGSKTEGLHARRTLDDLRAVRAAGVRLPIFPIGGITADQVPDLMEAGASGVAVISAVCGAGTEEALRAAVRGFLGRGSR